MKPCLIITIFCSRFYVQLRKIECIRPGYSPLQFDGIVTSMRKPVLLSPCLLGSCEGKFHIYVILEQKIDTPIECMGKSVVEWPSCFNSRYYKSPLMLSFEYYSHKVSIDHPSCKDDLHEYVLLGVSFLELYKGGAGFRAIEFRYVRHNQDLKDDATDSDQINKVKLSYKLIVINMICIFYLIIYLLIK